MIRTALNYVGWKERKAVAADLKEVYRASTADAASHKRDEFEENGVANSYQSRSLGGTTRRMLSGFTYPEYIYKIINTPNAIESLNMSLRKIIKNSGHLPNDAAAPMLLYLALKNASKNRPYLHGLRRRPATNLPSSSKTVFHLQ